jgi:hypothetical protein
MTDTVHLGLPCIEGSQAQKHVTHNDALRILDTLVQLAVLDRDLTAPPASPAEGQRWIVKATATGAWAGHDDAIAAWQDGAWQFSVPQTGWVAFVVDEGTLLVWNGTAWGDFFSTVTSIQNLALLGIGTTADGANPLSAKLNNTLFAAKTVSEGGDGNLHYTLSKENAAKSLSFLFQDNYSGRAEIGLAGDDDFHFKVSPDGSSWIDALVLDRATGIAKVTGFVDAATQAPIASMVFTPGGDGAISIYRIDGSCGQNPRTATIGSIAGDVIALTTAIAGTFFSNTYMAGVAYVRIWNVSKTPEQSAWVKAQPAGDQLQVTDAADLAGWLSGETIQVGEPTSVTPGRVVALDISPMMQNVLGAVLPQKGIMVKGGLISGTALDQLSISATGESGSFIAIGQTQVADVFNGTGVTVIPCTQLSPISNSNLVFVRETIAGTGTSRIASSVALFV